MCDNKERERGTRAGGTIVGGRRGGGGVERRRRFERIGGGGGRIERRIAFGRSSLGRRWLTRLRRRRHRSQLELLPLCHTQFRRIHYPIPSASISVYIPLNCLPAIDYQLICDVIDVREALQYDDTMLFPTKHRQHKPKT
jgi:hypothetical protein